MDRSLLGRYENFEDGSSKYWHIIYDATHNTYTAKWGKIGYSAQGEKEYSPKEVNKKIKEKINKGYKKVIGKGYEEVIGANSVRYIMED